MNETQGVKLNNVRRLIYLILAIAIFCYVYFLIPINIFSKFPILISILAGVSVAFLLFHGITDYTKDDWTDKNPNDWRSNFMIPFVLLTIGLPIFFFFIKVRSAVIK